MRRGGRKNRVGLSELAFAGLDPANAGRLK